jgi:hypothetical protein
MTDKKLDIKLWPIGDLTPYELNVKKHDREQVARIVQSISKFGWDQPIVVDKHGVIIKGHGRRLAALELGLKTVPVLVRADLNPEQVRAARLSDNRAAISDIDPEMLKLELASLDLDLDGIFDAKELDFISADLGTMNEEMFVTDMDQVLADQKKDIDARMEKVSGADTRMPIAKAFGFKDISAAGKLAISNLMPKAEAATGLKNDEALVARAAGIA